MRSFSSSRPSRTAFCRWLAATYTPSKSSRAIFAKARRGLWTTCTSAEDRSASGSDSSESLGLQTNRIFSRLAKIRTSALACSQNYRSHRAYQQRGSMRTNGEDWSLKGVHRRIYAERESLTLLRAACVSAHAIRLAQR